MLATASIESDLTVRIWAEPLVPPSGNTTE
jgi:hypothetical protein